MKTKIISLSVALFFATNIFSQIKVFTGGSVTIGATTAASVNSVNHQVIGDKTGFFGSTSTPTSAALIRGNNAYSGVSTPDYTWFGDNQTGFFHPSSSVIGITIGNSEKFRFNSSGQILSAGSGGNPDFSWNSDPNTGMARAAADVLAFMTNGWGRLFINSNGQVLSGTSPKTASAPDYSWASDENTGIFSPSTDVLAFSTNGSERARFNSTGRLLINTSVSNAIVSTDASDTPASSFSVTLSSDWASASSITYINKANSGNYELRLNGTTKFYVAGQGWIYSDGNYLGSDKNIKDDIKSIDSAMSKVNKINGVLYKLKVEKQNPNIYGTAQEYMGVIAQDVEKVAPQVVKTLPDGTKAVCYEMLAGLFVEALKEQNAEIAQLKNDINNCCTKSNERLINSPQKGENTNGSINENINTGSYMKQNAPNPFSKETIIEFFITERNASSSILVFDMNGKLLKTLKLDGSGKGSIIINGNDFQPGMYYYSLIINNKEIDTKKMILTE